MTLKSSTRDERPLKIREKTNKQMRGESESPASKSVSVGNEQRALRPKRVPGMRCMTMIFPWVFLDKER